MALEKLKFELEEEKAQKSFYQSRHKEATVELQNKTKEVEDAKKKVISLENESMSKQAELKKAKNQLEEKENDIGNLGYDKDTLRNQVKEMQTQADNFKVRYTVKLCSHNRVFLRFCFVVEPLLTQKQKC
jgi:chromosome segregation ATPase